MSHLNERLPIFTERFRELKGERNDTEFAEFLGISRQTVGFFGNGNRLPDAVTLVKISQKCGVSADWLLGLSETKALEGELKQVCNYTGLNNKSVQCLHWLACLDEYPKPCLTLVNNILKSPILNFRELSYSAALLEIQAERSAPQLPRSPEEIQTFHQEKHEALLKNACKKMGEADWEVKITAHEASRRDKERAVRLISDAVEKTISQYTEIVKVLIAKELGEME